jgi:hypothetical protein
MGLRFHIGLKRRLQDEPGGVAVEFVGRPPRSVPGKLDPPGRAIGDA